MGSKFFNNESDNTLFNKLKKENHSLVEKYQTVSKEKQEEAIPKVSDPQIIISKTFI